MKESNTAALRHYVGGQWVEGQGARIASASAADERHTVAAGTAADASQVQEAFAAAKGAAQQWAATPMAARAGYL